MFTLTTWAHHLCFSKVSSESLSIKKLSLGHHHSPLSQQFKSSTFNIDFTPTTKGNFQQKLPTTIRNHLLQSLKPPAPNQPNHYSDHQTEKPQRVQLPLPLLPTLPPLTFSSPAPFSLQHHIDTKRYSQYTKHKMFFQFFNLVFL